MNIYILLANELLKLEEYIFYTSSLNGDFGFEYMKDYSGLMAQPPKTGASAGKVKNRKQGFFDIRILTGSRYAGKVTHRDLFVDLLTYSTLDNCFEIWKGEDPRTLGRSVDEKECLVTFLLLMFEQEVNWGTEEWQRGSNFNPYQRDPTRRRPRDMLMGFVRQVFYLGLDRLDELKYWMTIKPGSVAFNNPNGDNQFFNQYPPQYKRCFDELLHTDGAMALMVGDIREQFREIARKASDNPNYRSV